jgi:hypothetical protein
LVISKDQKDVNAKIWEGQRHELEEGRGKTETPHRGYSHEKVNACSTCPLRENRREAYGSESVRSIAKVFGRTRLTSLENYEGRRQV